MQASAISLWRGKVRPSVQRAVIRVIGISRRPETLTFAGLFIVALFILLVNGYQTVALTGLANISAFVIFALLTERTDSAKTPSHATPARLSRFQRVTTWLQIILLVACFSFTGHELLALVGLAPPMVADIPAWAQLEFALEPNVTGSLLYYGSYVVAPTLLGALAFALFVLGARPRQLGIAHGYHAWRQALLWSFAPLALFLTGRMLAHPQMAAFQLLVSLFVTAPLQEFLFRGALLTRLSRVLSNGWALAISSCAFGLWHVGLLCVSLGTTSLTIGAAASIVTYGVLGLSTGALFLRTGNLLAPTILHGAAAALLL